MHSIAPSEIRSVVSAEDLPASMTPERLADALHESLKPYEDRLDDIHRALSRALSNEDAERGFVLLSMNDESPAGIAVVHRTPWSGYVPGHLLLYLAVAPAHRGRGLGKALLQEVIRRCDGDVKLHVEHGNVPAKRLYERAGFTSDYAEMRYAR